MREVICAHTGQAGIQLSSSVWELLCSEHGIQADGNMRANLSDEDNVSLASFFQEVPTGQFVPRAISIDLEPTVINEIRCGAYRKLFHPDQLISGLEDAANNFVRGHFSIGKDHIEYTLSKIRKVVDMCENLQGFLITNSYGGGTGSGFSTLLLERLSIEFAKKSIIQVAVFPNDRLSMATVEPYNTLLCTTSGIDNVDLCALFDNESLYNICSDNLDLPRPSYTNLNRVMSQVVSSMTVSVRFPGCLNAELDQIVTNLVPYPRIHFPVCSYAPILSQRKANCQQLSVTELTKLSFGNKGQLIDIDMSDGLYMCCCLQYRGKVTVKEVNDVIFDIKKLSTVKFVDWCPTGFKLGINSQPPSFIPHSGMADTPSSLAMLTNSTAISQMFRMLTKKFDKLFQKRSFVHWYIGEGMEENEFFECRDTVGMIISDYSELAFDGNNGTPVEEPIKVDVNEGEKVLSNESKKEENNEDDMINEKEVEDFLSEGLPDIKEDEKNDTDSHSPAEDIDDDYE